MATPKRVSHSLKSMCGRTLYIILLGLDNSLQPMGVLYLFFANHCINHVTDGAGFSTEDLPIVNLWIARFYTVYTVHYKPYIIYYLVYTIYTTATATATATGTASATITSITSITTTTATTTATATTTITTVATTATIFYYYSLYP